MRLGNSLQDLVVHILLRALKKFSLKNLLLFPRVSLLMWGSRRWTAGEGDGSAVQQDESKDGC